MLSVADVKVTGITKVGAKYLAAIEGPDRRSFNISLDDHLLDATVKSIDAEGVVFLETGADLGSGGKAREIRKALRRAAEDNR